jgi:DNA primase
MLIKNTGNKIVNHQFDTLQQEHPYLTKKLGLSQETIADFGIGYCTDKRKATFDRVIIPIHNPEGAFVGCAKHRPGKMGENGFPKYEFSVGFKKKLEIFNLDRAIKEVTARPLIIVQDLFDVLNLYQNGYRNTVALMADTMSPTQEKLIRESTNFQSCVLVMLNGKQRR